MAFGTAFYLDPILVKFISQGHGPEFKIILGAAALANRIRSAWLMCTLLVASCE